MRPARRFQPFRLVALLLVAICVSIAWVPHAGAWLYLAFGDKTSGIINDVANAVVVDSAGDAYAGGVLYNAATDDDFVVVKADSATGAEQWRYVTDGTSPNTGNLDDVARDIAHDGMGGVVAVGERPWLRDGEFIGGVDLAGAALTGGAS